MPPFRFCFNTSTIRDHQLPLDEVIDIAARAGYDAVEPWIKEIDAFVANGGALADLKMQIADRGLTVEGAIGFPAWIVDDPAQRSQGLEQARREMELVAAIGGTRIAAPPFGATKERLTDLSALAERYRALLEIGDQTGVVPILEMWGFSQTLSRLGEVAFVAAEAGHPNACILADVYHLYKGGSPSEGLRLLNGAKLPIFHVNDYPAHLAPDVITDKDRIFPGDGVAPITEILTTLRDIGFEGCLSLELFNPEHATQDPLTIAQTGLEKMRAVVETLA